MRRRREVPKIRHHKHTNQACVRLNGENFYFGTYGTQASKDLQGKKIAEWLANGRTLPRPELQPTKVEEGKPELV
jgi:hypothetical protein